MTQKAPLRIYIIGVCGCGKSLIGQGLADALALPFIEGDDHHPQANVDKMSAGRALDDDDRWPWLRALAEAGLQAAAQNGAAVIACSGLKKSYRELLGGGDARSAFVLLHGERALLAQRLDAREGHFMPASMLESQLATLEWPDADERWPVTTVDVVEPPDAIIARLREAFGDPRIEG